jgi:hypothetical protein
VYHLPAPSFILFAQLSGTALGVKVAHGVGAIEKLHPIRLDVARAFAPAALIFVATILLNMKSLENANVVRAQCGWASAWCHLEILRCCDRYRSD